MAFQIVSTKEDIYNETLYFALDLQFKGFFVFNTFIMAKELPYFKFNVADWLTGDIVYEDFDIQGLFINICAIYWQRKGIVSIGDINKRFKNPVQLPKLTDRFISVKDGLISIKFLDEQFAERKILSTTNSINGKNGGRPKEPKTLGNKPTANRIETESKPKQSNIEKKRKEKNIKINNKIFFVDSEIFDKNKFAEIFKDWTKSKMSYYFDAALRYSNEGNKYIDWIAAIQNWAKKDELQGKIKFNIPTQSNHDTDGIL